MSFNHSDPNQARKLPKGQLRCYHCKQTCPSKDGEWHDWQNMQVFLCKACEPITANRPERRRS